MLLTAACAATGAVVAWLAWGGALLAVLTLLLCALLALAVVLPGACTPVFRLMEGGVGLALRGLTWLLLGAVFVSVFIPGGIILRLRHRRRARPRAQSCWIPWAPARDGGKHFTAQY